jgi:hypothetical protein
MGIVLLGSIASAQNLLLNPGFETGSFAPWVARDWVIEMTDSGVSAHTGAFYADTGCVGGGCIVAAPGSGAWFYQDIATTPSATYTLSFYYASGQGGEDNTAELQVLWGPTSGPPTTGGAGSCTANCVYDNQTIGNTSYIHVSVGPLTATSASSRVEFLGRQDPAQMGIDDVCLVQTGSSSAGCISLSNTPVPPSVLLALLGLACIGFYFGYRNTLATS